MTGVQTCALPIYFPTILFGSFSFHSQRAHARVPITAARPRPTRSAVWLRATHGRSWQKLSWEVGPGVLTESLVVMNANGSPGIDIDAGIVVDVGFVADVFTKIRTAGIIALVVAVVLLIVVLRPRRPKSPPAGLPASGRPAAPGWR